MWKCVEVCVNVLQIYLLLVLPVQSSPSVRQPRRMKASPVSMCPLCSVKKGGYATFVFLLLDGVLITLCMEALP